MASVRSFRAAYKNRVAACTTAWDFPTAKIAAEAGMDLILIGDSTAIVSQGLDSSNREGPFLLGDLPLGTYEVNPERAVQSSLRLIKEAAVDGVKLEGGKEMVDQVAAITKAGIPVVGHIGLTPQRALSTLNQDIDSTNSSGDSKQSFGSTASSAQMVLEDAIALQEAGAVAVLIEAVTSEAAKVITETLKIPTIGIGCGSSTSAQMALQSELLGYTNCFLQEWHTQYASIGHQSVSALKRYRKDVQARSFPPSEHTYEMKSGESDKLQEIKKTAMRRLSLQVVHSDGKKTEYSLMYSKYL